MSSNKIDFGFSSQDFEEYLKRNKTVYKDPETKNPFRQTKKIDFFTTKVSFKDINMKTSRTDKFFEEKRRLQEERDQRLSQNSRVFTKGKIGIMNNLIQLHKKLDDKKVSPDYNMFGVQDYNRTKEIRFLDNFDCNIGNNINDLNNSLMSNQKSIIEELKVLRESFQIPESNLTKQKEKNQWKFLLNINKKEKGPLFLTNSRDNLLRKKKDSDLANNINQQNGKRIYFKQPLFNHKKIIVLNSKHSLTKTSLFPEIRVNKFLFNPEIIESKTDIYKNWTIRDIRIFEKCILPRFRNF